MITVKDKLLSAVDKVNALYSQSPVVKGLIDGGLSFIPFFGSAIISALDARSFEIYEKNSKQFTEESRRLVDNLDEDKIDKEFLKSDEFVSLLTEILTRNARTHEQAKVKLFATLFVNAATYGKSGTPYKEGFVHIIDELSVTHILALAFINDTSVTFTEEDKEKNRDYISASQVAEELQISEARSQAYCDQMIRFGLLRDWSLGRWNYRPHTYALTDYGRELAVFLKEESQ